eukprot:jgi/Orpsp1_1/1181264/evm.model.c7180000076506.1
MKVTVILSLIIAATSAVKANAIEENTNECFSLKSGYSCCKDENTEVIFKDVDGSYGFENGEWCGIIGSEIVSEEQDDAQVVDEELNDEGLTSGEEDQSSGEENQTPISENYMDKLQITNICPDEYRYMRNGVEYPTAQKIKYYSEVTETEREMNIILPIGYDENKKYPVVYFLHGLMADEDGMLMDESTLAVPRNLILDGKAKDMIMVLPDIYAPEPGTAVPPDYNPEYYKGYDNFINELEKVIMPYMEENYPILTGRENTAICGFSMGARTSLYIGYMKSELFGYVGAFAPAPGITPGEDSFSGYHPGLISEDEFRAEVPQIVSLIDCGTKDTVVGDFPKSYHEILTRNNQKHIWFEVPEADHDWNAISAGLYNFLQTTFGILDEN